VLVVVLVVGSVSGGGGSGLVDGGGGGEARECVQFYNIHMCLLQTPSKVVCNCLNEIEITS
jgi:hypothetical protein